MAAAPFVVDLVVAQIQSDKLLLEVSAARASHDLGPSLLLRLRHFRVAFADRALSSAAATSSRSRTTGAIALQADWTCQ